MLKLGSLVISSCTDTEETPAQFQIQRNWEGYSVTVLLSYINISKW